MEGEFPNSFVNQGCVLIEDARDWKERLFVGPDGRDYKWTLTSTTLEVGMSFAQLKLIILNQMSSHYVAPSK
jgi:hypothetical protein